MFTSESIKNLNDLELLLYKYVIKNSEKVVYMRIRELADEAHVSTTTILRFCKKFGCNGYSEFKIKLKMHLNNTHVSKVNNDTSLLIDYFKKLDNADFNDKIDAFCHVINSSNNVVFLGSGTSGIICKYAARYLSAMGKFASYIDDPYFPTNYKAYENSAIIILSVSGEIEAIVNIANKLKMEQCSILSITNSENCTIAKLSDLNIAYYVNQEKLGISDITTQLPTLFIIETIAKRLHNSLSEC